jgi:uncharacterized protein (DUF169 family)
MNIEFKEKFLTQWEKYFGNAELPITAYYSSGTGNADPGKKHTGRSCIICELSKVRNGTPVYYNSGSITCGGAMRYLGYTDKMRKGFEYFLSCGNEKIEGERYLRTPELVNEFLKNQKKLPVDGKNIIFKRWDKLTESDYPEIVIFFATPDVLSGLFTLANFDQKESNGTFTPFGAGCGSIIYFPYLEINAERPRAVIGLFDPSARPCVAENILTFSVPINKFEKMTGYMDESFLVTDTWKAIRKRINKK